MAWDSSKGFWANVGGGIADNTVEKIPGWDSSKGVFENVAGGIADNTVEKIPGWDSSKGVFANIGGGLWDNLRKYWYIPVIIGGVFIGYKVLTAGQMNKLLAAVAAKK